MQNNTVMGESRVGTHYLPDVRKRGNALTLDGYRHKCKTTW